ncbi:MAG: NUDIX hydrolase [Alphaproteobacteria bacterium]|nr:NUDIX hydrolase [Alphaproteobacteria bacterium]
MDIISYAARGIIRVNTDKFILLYRNKDSKEYYTIPGGHIEKTDKTIEDALKREIKEEIGIEVNVHDFLFETILEHWTKPGKYKKDSYYLCTYKSGFIGSGNAKEFSNPKKGEYRVEIHSLDNIITLPLVPKEVLNYLKDIAKKKGKTS